MKYVFVKNISINVTFYFPMKRSQQKVFTFKETYYPYWGAIVGDAEESGEEKLEERRKKTMEMIEYIEGQIEQGKRAGAKFAEVENLLAGARMMADSGNFEDAELLINQCSEMAGQVLVDFELLNTTLRRAEKEINEAELSGKNVEEAKRFLKLAKYHMAEGSYKMGVSYAKRGIESVSEKKKAEIAWGSALD
jgi:hypothetical protein